MERENEPSELPAKEERSRATGVGRIVEKAIENPTLVIAGLAAVPLLFLAWGVTRRWRKRRSESDNEE